MALNLNDPTAAAQIALAQVQVSERHTALLQDIKLQNQRLLWLAIQQDWHQQMGTPRYSDPRHLVPHGYKTYSQTDEDGIIAEIFRRIGTTNQRFIEFGVESGIECNTLNLLIQGWSGLWLDGSAQNIARIAETLGAYQAAGQLVAAEAFITAENINELFAQNGFTGEIDLLNIDIDGNDYWVWQAVNVVNPRVVVVEFNGTWRPPVSVVQPYRPDYTWNGGNNYFGASLKAFEKLGAQKGYALVGVNYGGGNAFFVRSDLVSDEKFLPPFTAEQHYEPPRFFFALTAGHPPAAGPLIQV